MLFLLDTNTISDLMGNHPKVLGRLGQLTPADRVITCPIVHGEVLFGIGRLAAGQRRSQLESAAGACFAALAVEPVPPSAAIHYAALKTARFQHGRPLDENDLWIAATALALGAVLVTRDRDFGAIEGLDIQDWTL